MRIGFDAKKAAKNHTGIGNYSRRCIKALSDYRPENALILFAPQGGKAWGNISKIKNIEIFAPVKGFLYEIWRIFLLPFSLKKKRIDIYHGLSNELPLGIKWGGCKSIVTIHDLIFIRHPETYSWSARMILKFKTQYACKHADHIIAVSEKTKEDLIDLYHVDGDKITVIYQSIDPKFFNAVPDEKLEEVKRKYLLPNCYILCVGTIEKRKNQATIVKALTGIRQDVHLVIVGKRTPYQDEVEKTVNDTKLNERVHIYNCVPSKDLSAFYQMAKVFCLMSVYEGFGIPIAEALASGVPVIAASGSCLEEAGGPDSIYVDACDYHMLSSSVDFILKNHSETKKIIDKGKGYAKNFNDQYLASQIIELYKSL